MKIPVQDKFTEFVEISEGRSIGIGLFNGKPYYKSWNNLDIVLTLTCDAHDLLSSMGIEYDVYYEWDDSRRNNFFIQVEDEKQAILAKLYLS